MNTLKTELKNRYPSTAWRGITWDTLMSPHLEAAATAQDNSDYGLYWRTLQDLCYKIYDGHVSCSWNSSMLHGDTSCADASEVDQAYTAFTGQGFGVNFARDADGKVRVTHVPSNVTGLQAWDEVILVNGVAVDEAVASTSLMYIHEDNAIYPATSPNIDTEQLNMLARSGPSGLLNLTIAGKGNVLLSSSAAMLAQTRTMGTAWEQFGSDSCITASVLPGLNDGPEVGLLGVASFEGCSGFGEAVVEAVRMFKQRGVAGVIVDMRGNGGGDDDKVPTLLRSFISNPPFVSGNATYSASPVDIAERFAGKVVVTVNRKVMSNGDIAAHALFIGARAEVVGLEGTSGSVSKKGNAVVLPCARFEYTFAQRILESPVTGRIQLEANRTASGTRVGGTLPTNAVPRNEDNLAAHAQWRLDQTRADPVLDFARGRFSFADSPKCASTSGTRSGSGSGCCYTVSDGSFSGHEDVSPPSDCPCTMRFDAGVSCASSSYVNPQLPAWDIVVVVICSILGAIVLLGGIGMVSRMRKGSRKGVPAQAVEINRS